MEERESPSLVQAWVEWKKRVKLHPSWVEKGVIAIKSIQGHIFFLRVNKCFVLGLLESGLPNIGFENHSLCLNNNLATRRFFVKLGIRGNHHLNYPFFMPLPPALRLLL